MVFVFDLFILKLQLNSAEKRSTFWFK